MTKHFAFFSHLALSNRQRAFVVYGEHCMNPQRRSDWCVLFMNIAWIHSQGLRAAPQPLQQPWTFDDETVKTRRRGGEQLMLGTTVHVQQLQIKGSVFAVYASGALDQQFSAMTPLNSNPTWS